MPGKGPAGKFCRRSNQASNVPSAIEKVGDQASADIPCSSGYSNYAWGSLAGQLEPVPIVVLYPAEIATIE